MPHKIYSDYNVIAWRIDTVPLTSSTMNIVHEKAAQGEAEYYVVRAEQQSSARGRGGNIWLSPLGNLSCSILLRPKIQREQAGQYSFLTAVALGRAFDDLIETPNQFQHKWPNDVLINMIKGAGILLETGAIENGYLDYLNIGVGVNIQNAPEDKICLHQVSKTKLSVSEFLDLFLEKFVDVIDIYNASGFLPIREEWLSNAYGLNTQIQVRLPNEILLGEFCGLTEFGALELKLLSGETKIIHSGDVFFGWSLEDIKIGATG